MKIQLEEVEKVPAAELRENLQNTFLEGEKSLRYKI